MRTLREHFARLHGRGFFHDFRDSPGWGLTGSDDWPAPAVVPSPDWTFVAGDPVMLRDTDIVLRSALIEDDWHLGLWAHIARRTRTEGFP